MPEFAPGIPKERSIRPSVNIKPGVTRMILHEHAADRAGTHYDLRIQEGDYAHSWAIPKATLPEQSGDKVLAVQQATHTSKYMDFTGEITHGYGKGVVGKPLDTEVYVWHSSPDKIKFHLPGKGDYAMINTKDKDWLLLKMKERVGDITYKPKYKELHYKDINIYDKSKVLQPKLDGAHMIVELGKRNKVYSYRTSKRTGTTIDHSHKLDTIRDAVVPKELHGTVLRAEVYGTKGNKTLASHHLAGLLNSGLIKVRRSLETQKVKLRALAFDVIRHKGKPAEHLPYKDKWSILKAVNKAVPEVELPEVAWNPQDKTNLLRTVQMGRHPLTNEGIVQWDLTSPTAAKAIVKQETDVYIRKIDPQKRRFFYSRTKTGPIVGKVGTGFSQAEWAHIKANPAEYEGRVARVHSKGEFPSKALRAPSYKSLHLDKNMR